MRQDGNVLAARKGNLWASSYRSESLPTISATPSTSIPSAILTYLDVSIILYLFIWLSQLLRSDRGVGDVTEEMKNALHYFMQGVYFYGLLVNEKKWNCWDVSNEKQNCDHQTY